MKSTRWRWLMLAVQFLIVGVVLTFVGKTAAGPTGAGTHRPAQVEIER